MKRRIKARLLLAPIKREPGRPSFKVTPENRKTVAAMVSYGIPEIAIGAAIGCSHTTLRKHFAPEIATAQAQANATIASTLFNQAVNGNTTAMIFWLKCRAGWKEKQEITHVGPDGGPLQIDRIELVLVNGKPKD